MTEIKRRKVETGLRNKGFQRENTPRDHIWYMLIINEQPEPRVRTHMSMGSHGQIIHDKNLKRMSLELHMDSKNQFLEYIHCPYKYNEYIEDLQRKNII